MIISYIEGRHLFSCIENDIFFSWIEGRHFVQWMKSKYVFTHGQGQNYFFAKTMAGLFFKPSPPPGNIMVAPLFIEEENSKLPQQYSNCVKFVAFRHS